MNLDELRKTTVRCAKCPDPDGRRGRLVFGEGSPTAALMLIGEAPGETEEDTGIPFSGAAGKLLDKILADVGICRSDVFITNVLQCRPTKVEDMKLKNREPTLDEIHSCVSNLFAKISIIHPKVILALGRFSGRVMLNSTADLRELRKMRGQYQGIPVFVTYHPASLLYNPANKQDVWEDFHQVKELISA